MVQNFLKLEIPSKSENESLARIVISAFAAQLDPTIEEISDLKIAVSEAVTNAIIHAYDSEEGIIYIHAFLEENKLTLEVIDHGMGIEDLEQARQPLFTTKPELERSGMGFTIMESFMDKVEVESFPGQGTTVRMVKEINKNKKVQSKEG
ncbi:MAG: anti-sigma F factor [Dethiobacteria bacterium]|jgi:stage II sporulation protein AB (anti-sigma F factor)|nr:anti-sigma F factor [Bacillota bacterium]